MHAYLRKILLGIILLIFSGAWSGCDKDDLLDCVSEINLPASGNVETDRAFLEQLYNGIVADAGANNCMPNAIWKFAAAGSKPCGGPASYLIYNAASLDESCFLARLKQFNALAEAFNRKHGLASDCAIVPVPREIVCMEGIPILVY